jgi:hypothetical protein
VRRFLLASWFCVACSKPDAVTAKPDPAKSVPTTTSAAPTPPAKFACTTDKDCFMSCGAGAVSAKWWDAWDKNGECKDGCAEMNVAKCTEGRCLAYDYNSGKLNAGCSNRP